MKKLLAIEWMKVKNYRTFWVLIVLFVVAIIGMNFICYKINNQINETTSKVGFTTGNPFDFPNVWGTLAWLSSWVLYFPGFIIIFLISNEYQFKTHRQNIIDGMSRKEFVWVKLIDALILTVACTVIVFFTTLIFGLFGSSKITFEGVEAMGNFFVCSWVYILFATLLAFLFRKAALAIGIYFIYGLIVDNIITGLIKNSFNGKPYGTYFLPIDVADGLLTFPFFKSAVKMINQSPNVYLCFGICIAWIIFYHWFTVKKFDTEDL
jgi:ABC-2 type transport system permease protein